MQEDSEVNESNDAIVVLATYHLFSESIHQMLERSAISFHVGIWFFLPCCMRSWF